MNSLKEQLIKEQKNEIVSNQSHNNSKNKSNAERKNHKSQQRKEMDQPKSQTITETTITFNELDLIDPLLQGIAKLGYTHPTPIQVKAIPIALQGRDILGTAQTGSGKTAAFALPLIQRLVTNPISGNKYPRALILSPTRELASQIADNIDSHAVFTDIEQVTIYGGVSQKPQVRQIKQGIDIIVATPGRLLDLINQREVRLNKIEILVIDEADRMMDMGFIKDITKIIRMVPENAQTMLFSATMPKSILQLADQVLKNPERISVDPPTSTVDTIESKVFFVEKSNKFNLLAYLMQNERIEKALIFMRTKHSANNLVRKLKRKNIKALAIHGNKSQAARERALDDFRKDKVSILVGTDVAARGIDVDDITHVINYDMSNQAETYIHRTGRTARAGKSGIAYNFCEESERPYLRDIEILTKQHLIRVEDYPYKSHIPEPELTNLHPSKKNRSRNSSNHKNNSSKRQNHSNKRKNTRNYSHKRKSRK